MIADHFLSRTPTVRAMEAAPGENPAAFPTDTEEDLKDLLPLRGTVVDRIECNRKTMPPGEYPPGKSRHASPAIEDGK